MVYESEYRRPYVSSRPTLSTYSVTVGEKSNIYVLQRRFFLIKNLKIWNWKLNFDFGKMKIWNFIGALCVFLRKFKSLNSIKCELFVMRKKKVLKFLWIWTLQTFPFDWIEQMEMKMKIVKNFLLSWINRKVRDFHLITTQFIFELHSGWQKSEFWKFMSWSFKFDLN